MAIRAVIFDRDGVLTHFDLQAAATFLQPLAPLSVFELFRRWQQLGEKIGFPTSVAAEAVFLRSFWRQISAECRLTAAQGEALAAVDYTHFVAAFPEARQVLAELHEQKLKLGVLSNFALASLERSLAAAGLSSWLDATCAATVIGAAKPDLAAYLSVAQALAVAPNECAFFDDEAANVEGGRRAGMRSFLVDRRLSGHDFAAGVVCNLTGVTGALAFLAARDAAPGNQPFP